MDERKLEIIKELMAQLESEMSPSPDDLGERLGRPKPEAAVEIEIGGEESGEMPEDEMSDDMGMDDEMMGPEDKLKQRILKMRG